MDHTLIVAHLPFAGMIPYVSEIVNTLSPNDNIHYMFFDIIGEDSFYKSVKLELRKKSTFCRFHHGVLSKADFALGIYSARNRNKIVSYCVQHNVTVVHFINGYTDVKTIKMLQKLDIKVLLTVHDLHPHECKKAFYKMWKYETLSKQEMECVRLCRNLVTNSRIQFEELKVLFPEKNISFHEFPSLVSEPIKTGGNVPNELNNLNGRKYILFFGRIEEYKGIQLLYAAFGEMSDLWNDYALVIAGSGKLELDSAMRSRISENVIEINRYIDDSEVAFLYSNAAAVVYPYISATQSGVLSLGCYFQTPMLVSDIPYFKSMAGESGIALLFQSGNVEDLKRKLGEILYADNERMRQKQRSFYDRFYHGKSIRENLLKIYNGLM